MVYYLFMALNSEVDGDSIGVILMDGCTYTAVIGSGVIFM
jgi:hypothetical protein